jgi:selenide,water dikinase
VPERELENLLKSTGLVGLEKLRPGALLMGPGEDAGAVRLSERLAYVAHTDFFTPIVDDPYLYGRIAAFNAASDLFAKGCTENLGFLAILGAPLELPDEVLQKILTGIRDACVEMDASILGGHSIISPWPIAGGSVVGTAEIDQIVKNSTARVGDTVLLTKPLGTQPLAASMRVPRRLRRGLLQVVAEPALSHAESLAVKVMNTPNKLAAQLMRQIGVDACTDVTGFGILNHANIMAERSGVRIIIDELPVIKGALELSRFFGYGLEEGISSETSGGLLISVPRDRLEELHRLFEANGVSLFRIGRVEAGAGAALAPNVRILEVLGHT